MLNCVKNALKENLKKKIALQRKLRWHTPGEIMNIVYQMGRNHWDAKEAWIMEAVRRGGTGSIMCTNCDVYEKDGFGAAACQDCKEAWRELPDGTIEYWTD